MSSKNIFSQRVLFRRHKLTLTLSLITAILLSSTGLSAQEVQLLTLLDAEIEETSGLIEIEGRLITHNDSGNEPVLYEVDTLIGAVLRRVTVINAENKDWEDICADGQYIYVGDIGNNSGNRTDLRIYRVAIADYMSSDSVIADTIAYHYADQTDFTSSTFSTNYDAEGLTVIGDSLYIFTKNWGDFRSNLYTVSKLPGSYSAHRRDSLDTQGMVTGATYVDEEGILALCGYTFLLQPFVTIIQDFPAFSLEAASSDRISYSVPPGISRQTEAIFPHNDGGYYISTERSFTGSPALMYFNQAPLLSENQMELELPPIFPNPATDSVTLPLQEGQKALIYNMEGKQVATSGQAKFSTRQLASGTYIVLIATPDGSAVGRAGLVVE